MLRKQITKAPPKENGMHASTSSWRHWFSQQEGALTAHAALNAQETKVLESFRKARACIKVCTQLPVIPDSNYIYLQKPYVRLFHLRVCKNMHVYEKLQNDAVLEAHPQLV